MINMPQRQLEGLLYVLVTKFSMRGKEAAIFADKLVRGMGEQDLEIVSKSRARQMRGAVLTWEDLVSEADRLERERGGIKPWMPPELQ